MTRLRVKRTTETLPSGARVTKQKLVVLPELEWRLQAAAVRALKALPEYMVEPGAGLFTLAADMNSGRRNGQEAVKAAATGIAAGDPDLRIYAAGGRLLMIEYKNAVGRLSVEQKARHAILRALGYTVEVVKVTTPEEAAERTVDLVLGWLAANDQQRERKAA